MTSLNEGGDRGVVARHAKALGGVGPLHTWGRLFLTMPEAAALTVLLVCDQGWNRSVLDAMTVPDDMPGAGEDGLDIYRVLVIKRRRPPRTRHASVNLVDAGPDTSGRLIRQAIEATEPARITLAALGEPTSRLLVSRRATPAGKTMFCLGAPPGDSLRRWAASSGLADDGGPGQVSLRRLRRTVQVLIRREPAQNTARTHEQVYVLRDPATRPEAEQVTAQGLTDAVGHAREVMQMRMLLDAGADQLTDYAGSPQQAQALAAGTLDTATGACLDYTHSPFSPPGQSCTASFLDCLACRNAVATRRRPHPQAHRPEGPLLRPGQGPGLHPGQRDRAPRAERRTAPQARRHARRTGRVQAGSRRARPRPQRADHRERRTAPQGKPSGPAHGAKTALLITPAHQPASGGAVLQRRAAAVQLSDPGPPREPWNISRPVPRHCCPPEVGAVSVLGRRKACQFYSLADPGCVWLDTCGGVEHPSVVTYHPSPSRRDDSDKTPQHASKSSAARFGPQHG